MKNLFKTLIIATIVTLTWSPARAFDLRDILRGVAGAGNDSTASAGSAVSDIISNVANAFGFGSGLSINDLDGSWTYKEPAVSFKSDNLLMKAGGIAAAKAVEDKLEPYYKMAGVESMKLTINAADSTFTMKLKLGTFSGNITQSDDGKQIFFNFTLFKRVKIGTVEAFISKKTGNEIEITYDVTGLLAILEKAGSITGKSSIKALTALLNQYDGMTAGFVLQKQSGK